MVTPREKRQAKTRQEILDAAVALIGENGPDNFSLRALARRVDYSPAGLYEYFDGKDDIVNAVCAEGDLRLQTYLKRVPGDLPIDLYLVELGLAYIDFAHNNVEHFMLMFARIPNSPLIPYADVAANETYGILLDAVQTAVEEGFVHVQPRFNRDDIAYALWSLAHGLAVMQITNLSNIDYNFAQADRGALRAFVRGLAAA